jgi:hypothetical protein
VTLTSWEIIDGLISTVIIIAAVTMQAAILVGGVRLMWLIWTADARFANRQEGDR